MSGARHIARANLRQFGYYLLTGLILVIPALMNKSPLVYSDSGTYMRYAFDIDQAIDRPVGYSLIIRAVTWRSTMWSLIFFQGTIASWLLFEVLRQLFPGKIRLWRLHIAMIGLLTLLSSLPWYASQIMPDVVAGLLALVVFLLFFGRGLNELKLAFLWVLLFFFTISHYSFMAMMVGLIVFLAIARLTSWGKRALGAFFWKKWAGLVALLAGGFFYLIDLNHRNGHGTVLSPTSDLFIAAKLVESGVMYEHLKRTCPERDHWLCHEFNDFNTSAMHYVWDEDNSLRQHLEMEKASHRLAPLVHEILVDPRNWGMLLWVGSSRVDLQACKLEYSIVSPK